MAQSPALSRSSTSTVVRVPRLNVRTHRRPSDDASGYPTPPGTSSGLSDPGAFSSGVSTPRSDDSVRLAAKRESYVQSRAANSSTASTKKKGVLGFLALKEPSTSALAEYARAQQIATPGRKSGHASKPSLSGVSSQKLPSHVPKVNSKWDGLPERDRRKSAAHSGGSRHGSSIVTTSITSSEPAARPSPSLDRDLDWTTSAPDDAWDPDSSYLFSHTQTATDSISATSGPTFDLEPVAIGLGKQTFEPASQIPELEDPHTTWYYSGTDESRSSSFDGLPPTPLAEYQHMASAVLISPEADQGEQTDHPAVPPTKSAPRSLERSTPRVINFSRPLGARDADAHSLAPSVASSQWRRSPKERLGLGGQLRKHDVTPWEAGDGTHLDGLGSHTHVSAAGGYSSTSSGGKRRLSWLPSARR